MSGWARFTHPAHPGAGIHVDAADPWTRLAESLATPLHRWQTEGWRMAPEDLMCPRCKAVNLPAPARPTVELEKDARGLWVVCACCGVHSRFENPE